MDISDRDVAKLMGRVFIEQAGLNLLGSVLDTPDFFWEAGVGDQIQAIYERVGGRVGAARVCAWRRAACGFVPPQLGVLLS